MKWLKVFGRFDSLRGIEEEVEDIDFDVDDCCSIAVDGIIVNGDNEEVKLLFYSEKPGFDGGYKGLIECRVTKRKFLDIVWEVNQKALGLKDYSEESMYT